MRNLLQRYIYIALAVVLAVSVVSCYKDSEELILYPDNPWGNEQKVALDIIGEVVDEQGEAISDATVLVENAATHTDANGVFSFFKVITNPNLISIRVQKKGYFEANKVINGDKDIQNQVKIVLAKSIVSVGINAAQGGEALLGKASLKIPANAIVDKSGKPFTGNIRVSGRFLNTTEIQENNIALGDGRGVDLLGTAKTLSSYGMLLLDVTDNSGNRLDLAEGKEATVVFPTLKSYAGNTINKTPLWHFDRIAGLWRQNSDFNIESNNSLTAKIQEFSPINCAESNDIVEIKGRFTNTFGVSVSNKSVIFVGNDGYKSAIATATATGFFKISLPKNQKGQLKIIDPFCKATLTTYNEINIVENTDLGNIVLDETLTSRSVRGNVMDCDGKPLSNGYVELTLKDKLGKRNFVKVFLNPDGSFKYDINITSCIPNVAYVEATAYNTNNNTQSALSLVQVLSAHTNLGTISFCTSTSQYIIVSFADSTIYSKQPLCDLNTNTILLSSIKDNKSLTFQYNKAGANLTTNTPYEVYYTQCINFFPFIEVIISQDVIIEFKEVSLKKGDFVSGTVKGQMIGISGYIYKLSGSFRFKKP